MSLTSDQFISSISDVDAKSFKNEVERSKARSAAEALIARLELPWEKSLDIVWKQPILAAGLKLAVDVKLFEKWAAKGGEPSTKDELASMTGVDPVLLSRFLKNFAAMHVLKETAEGTYAMTDFTTALGQPVGFANSINYGFDVNIPGFANLPTFLADEKYKNPVDPTRNNWTHLSKSNQTLFEFLAAHPTKMQDFQHTMKANTNSKVGWVDIYPTEELFKGAKPDRAIVVDIGGGQGYDLERMRARYPDLPAGSLYLEDLPSTVEGVSLKEPCKALPYDFFEPQPIKGARAYYLHVVLHDWPDVKAKEILVNIAAAMERGYSKVLIHESIVGRKDSHELVSTSDLTMLMVANAAERSEATWVALLASAGLKITQIWTSAAAFESVIEAELA